MEVIEKFSDIEIDGLSVSANAGSPLHRCIQQAAILAMIEEKTVVLTHNENRYEIKPEYIMSRLYALLGI